MEDISNILPRGIRFHPFDEEIIYYVDQKNMNPTYTTSVMKEVNLNNSEPWVLLGMMEVGEKEIYVLGQHGRKYTTGSRIDRSTEYGFWKTTGKDKKIYKGEEIIGKRSTLVFYTGRAPHGEKTNWVMNEFRTERSDSTNPPTQNEWVVARISYNGIMDGSERRNPFEKHLEMESAIVPGPVPESPIFLAPVTDSRAPVLDSPIMSPMDNSYLHFELVEKMVNPKQLVLDSPIWQAPVLKRQPPIMPDPVTDSAMSAMVLEISSMMDFKNKNHEDLWFNESSWVDVGATSNTYLYSAVDYTQTPPCLNKDLEVMKDLPPLTDESEFVIEDWIVVPGKEKENEKETEMGGSD